MSDERGVWLAYVCVPYENFYDIMPFDNELDALRHATKHLGTNTQVKFVKYGTYLVTL